MTTQHPSHAAIGTNLIALRAILRTAIIDIEHGLVAMSQGEQNTAIGSILPVDDLLKQATVLFQAVIVLHRQY